MRLLLSEGLHRAWEWLEAIDRKVFLKINNEWTNGFLDGIFPWWREAKAWVPLYLFLVLFGILNFGKRFWPWLLFIALTLLLTDQTSSSLIKKTFVRPRPCMDEDFMGQVRLMINHCSGGYSFTSSHATNHFGFAAFVMITLRNVIGKWRYLLLFWAATISYGQVYVGVHYPLDVLCGTLLGSCIGTLTANIYHRTFGPLNYNPVVV